MGSASDQKEMSALDKERMHDVHLLLDNLFRREERTVLMVLDCLYDIGSQHLVDQKIRIRLGQRIAKTAVRPVKPVFKAIAIRWFKSNVPQLLSDWLYSQVSFEPDEGEEDHSSKATALPATEASLIAADQPSDRAALPAASVEVVSIKEVEQLQQRVRLLAGVSIVAIAALIGTLIV